MAKMEQTPNQSPPPHSANPHSAVSTSGFRKCHSPHKCPPNPSTPPLDPGHSNTAGKETFFRLSYLQYRPSSSPQQSAKKAGWPCCLV